jgi:hypothetical protein
LLADHLLDVELGEEIGCRGRTHVATAHEHDCAAPAAGAAFGCGRMAVQNRPTGQTTKASR